MAAALLAGWQVAASTINNASVSDDNNIDDNTNNNID